MLVASGFAARLRALFAAVWIAGTLAVDQAAAQGGTETYPNRAVRLVVPFPAGGPTDILSRVVAQRLSEVWGQPVVIENQPGANTAIAAARVAKMPADGYTLLAAMDVTMVLNPITTRNLSYDPLKDFVPITLGSKNTSLLSVRAEDGPKTVKELITRAKANPGKLNYGAGIITTRLAGYLFNREAGLDVQYIPFNGSPPTVQGLLTGAVDYIVDGAATSLPLIQSGQAQQPSAPGAARGQAARRRSRHSGARRRFDLDRICGAGRYPAQHRRQDSTRNRQDVRRSGDRRKAGKSRHQHRQQFTGGIRCLRAQRTGSLGSSIQG
jgi:tripartite-type tricarboxylate transporter receptor subunit TctC